MNGPSVKPNPANVSIIPTTVDIRPGKVTTLIANELVTKQASPNASVHRTTIEAQKKSLPDGRKLRKPNKIVDKPVINNPVMNIRFDPITAI
jgi:hypothetical protein